MGLQDKRGTMGRKLRELGVTNDGGLRLIINALLEPTTQMVDAGWDATSLARAPTVSYKAMLRAALLDLIDDEKQSTDRTDAQAKQHAMLHEYLHRAGIEKETEK